MINYNRCEYVYSKCGVHLILPVLYLYDSILNGGGHVKCILALYFPVCLHKSTRICLLWYTGLVSRAEFESLVDALKGRRRPCIIIAHRGAPREAPENTLPSIQRALDLGAGGVEIDVLLTSDKVPVVTHNDDLSILTHYRGYAHQTPFATVKSLDAGSHFKASFAGTQMPTLAEALEALASHDVMTIVEIKAQPGMVASAAELIGGIVSDSRMQGPVAISSSSLRMIHELGRRHPRISRALIVRRAAFSLFLSSFFARVEELAAMCPSLNALSSGLVRRMRSRGVDVHAWTANEPDEFDMCLGLGVDGIITDDIAFAVRYLDEAFGGVRT